MDEQKVVTKKIDEDIQEALHYLNDFFYNILPSRDADTFGKVLDIDMEAIEKWRTIKAVGEAVIEMNRRLKGNG